MRYDCPDCSRYYTSKHRLMIHRKNIHKKREILGDAYSCCFCGEGFRNDEGLTWHLKQEHGESKTRLDNGMCYIKKYRRVKKEVPEKYHDVFDELTGQGKGLLSVQAAISYIEAPITQDVAAETFGVSTWTVRKAVEDIVDYGAVSLEYVQDNCINTGDKMFGNRTSGERKWQPEA